MTAEGREGRPIRSAGCTDEQRFAEKSWVLLHDSTGEIPDEIAQVLELGYEGDGMYCVCVPRVLRDDPRNDVDGLREVHEDDMRFLFGDGKMTPRVPQNADDAVSIYVGCSPLGDVRCDWGVEDRKTKYRGWWFFPEDGRVDAIPLVPRHTKVEDIRTICLATLADRFGWRPKKD